MLEIQDLKLALGDDKPDPQGPRPLAGRRPSAGNRRRSPARVKSMTALLDPGPAARGAKVEADDPFRGPASAGPP
ncbi:hypothetical protein ACRAWD_20265 [Caulobacter segnis]